MRTAISKLSSLVLLLAIILMSSCEKESFAPTPDPIDDIDDITSEPVTIDQEVLLAIPSEDYQNEFELKVRNGYRPVWIDGFIHRAGVATSTYNTTRFNVIFEKVKDGEQWAAYHGLSSSKYQEKYDEMKSNGYRLEFIESYMQGNNIRYAPIFVKKSGPALAAVHGLPHASWQNYFDDKVADGYRLVNRSVVVKNGNKYVTALFDKKNVGSWISKSNMNLAQTQATMENNLDAGRVLRHLDISQTTSTDFTFGAIFDKDDFNNWYAPNGLTQAELEAEIAEAESNGYKTTIVSAYDVFELVNGNETYAIRFAAGFVK